MTVTYYESVKGGTNNLAVALDQKTGETSGSTRSKEHAHQALKRKLARRAQREQEEQK